MSVPREAIREDHRLEKASESTAEELMRHRWHWTLDESNPQRVNFTDYARSVGRNRQTITRQVKGYAEWRTSRGARSLADCITTASMGAETEAAYEAVAEARGITVQRVRDDRPSEVKRVREVARERAEKHGTTVEEEARKVADWTVKAEKARTSQNAERKDRLGLRFISMEGHLLRAKKALVEALGEAHGVPWEDEHRELLADTVANVKALLGLIDMALVGAADVDWDAELGKLTEVA